MFLRCTMGRAQFCNGRVNQHLSICPLNTVSYIISVGQMRQKHLVKDFEEEKDGLRWK